MAQDMLELISHLIDRVEADASGKGKLAYGKYNSEGEINRDDFLESVSMLSPLNMMPEAGVAISCGATANVLCHVFAKKRILENTCSLGQLAEIVADNKPRIIRIDLVGHSYVIEQIATPGGTPTGNIYQSNIAVLSNPDFGITMYKYLHEHQNPVHLLDYFKNLAIVCNPSANAEARQDLYLKMFTVPSYLENPDTNAPKIEDATRTSTGETRDDVLAIKKISYESYEHKDVLGGVQMILKFVDLGDMVAAQEIYYRCIA